MTNQELNLAIAKLVYPQFDFRYGNFASEVVGYLPNTNCWQVEKDYCNNWNDLMPLVIEHGIEIEREYYDDTGYTGRWEAAYEPMDGTKCYHCSIDTDPQIALAECLLAVLTAKEEAKQ